MMFEGAPLVSGGRLYVARTQFDGRQAISTILCYDADGPGGRNEPPALRWKQDVWIVEPPAEPVRHRHDVLTLAGPNVVYCTHSGAIVALDAITGKRAWAYRYPIADSRALDGVQPHDLSPCIAANGRIFAAPADSNHLLCLEARTGALIWKSQPIHVVQTLGVANGLVFATLGSFPQGMRAYRVSDGGIQWTQPDVGNLAAFGRGFITDRWIIWPTSHGLRVLRQDHGDLIHAGSNDEPWGNLALGQGCLIVATPSEIWGFVPERMRLGQLRMDVKQTPNDAPIRYRAALAEADAGNWHNALDEFRKSEELAAGESIQGVPLQEAARHRRHEILIMQAEQAWKLNSKAEAGAKLREACGEPYSLNDRVRAWAFRIHAGDRTFPDVFENPQLADLWLTQPDGLPIRAGDYLLGLLDRGGKQHWENRAAALLAKDPGAAIRQLPTSVAVRAELRRRATQAESAGNVRAAAENYRRLPMNERLGLAAIYDQAGYKSAAQIIRHRINAGKFALADPPIVSHTLDVKLPLKPAATLDLQSNHEWPLGPLRDPSTGGDLSPISVEGCAFFFDTNRVLCRSLTSGKAVWARPIDHDARWCVFHTDSVIVAGTTGVSRLDRRGGRIEWTFTRPDRRSLPAGFPDAEFRTLNLQIESTPFSSFCVAGSQLYFLWGDELLALDVESGEPLWNLRAPGAPYRSTAPVPACTATTSPRPTTCWCKPPAANAWPCKRAPGASCTGNRRRRCGNPRRC